MPACAQGVVHLGPGDSYLYSNATRLDFGIFEGFTTNLWVTVLFSNDSLGPGDSFQIDASSSPPVFMNLATGIATNYTSGTEWSGFQFKWDAVGWNGNQPGTIRLTMLAGSMDVSSVLAYNVHYFNYEHYSFAVPEPSASLLIAAGVGLFAGARRLKHRKR